MENNYNQSGKRNKKLSESKKAVLLIVAICLVNVLTIYYFYGLSKTELSIYKMQMPTETVSAEVIKTRDFTGPIYSHYDIDYYQMDYGDDYYNNGEPWHSVQGFFKPTKKLPDIFGKDTVVWELNDDIDFLLFVEGGGLRGCSAKICVNRDLLDKYDFLTSKLSSVEVGNVEISDSFSEEEINTLRQFVYDETDTGDYLQDYFDFEKIRQYAGETDDEKSASEKADEYFEDIKTSNNSEYYGKIPYSDFKRSYEIYWYFEGLDGICRVNGLIVETIDGRLYATHNLSEGQDGYESRALFELDGEMRSKMQRKIDEITTPKKVFNEHELAREMKNNAKK